MAPSSEKHNYLTNTFWLVSERVIRLIGSILIGVLVARYLGPERFGTLSLVLSLVALFAIFGTLGLDSVVVRDVVKEPDQSDYILGTAFLLKMAMVPLTWLVLWLATLALKTDPETFDLVLLVALGMLFQTSNVIDFFFQAKVKSKYVVFAQIIQLSASITLRLVLLYNEMPLIYFAAATILDAVILALGLAYFYFDQKGRFRLWRWSTRRARKLLSASWPLLLSGVAVVVYMKIDQIMIKQMLGSRELGYYSVAVRISESWYFVPVAITGSLFPAIVIAKEKGQRFYADKMYSIYSLVIWIAIVAAGLFIFLSEPLIDLLFGEAYKPAADVLKLHILAGIFVSSGVANGRWMLTENLQYITTINTVIGAAINILLNLVLLPRYGINGAAIATVLSYLYAGVIGIYLNPKSRPQVYLMVKGLFMPSWQAFK